MDFLSSTLKSVASNAQKVVEEGKQLLEDVDSNANLYLSPSKLNSNGDPSLLDRPEQDLLSDRDEDVDEDDDEAEEEDKGVDDLKDEVNALRNYVRELQDHLELLQEEKGSMVETLRHLEADRLRVQEQLDSVKLDVEKEAEENRRCFTLLEQELAEKTEILEVKSQENDLLKREMKSNAALVDEAAKQEKLEEMKEELQILHEENRKLKQRAEDAEKNSAPQMNNAEAVIKEAERLAAQQFGPTREDSETFDGEQLGSAAEIEVDFEPGSKEWQRAMELAKTGAALEHEQHIQERRASHEAEMEESVVELQQKCAELEEKCEELEVKLEEEVAAHAAFRGEAQEVEARAVAAEEAALKAAAGEEIVRDEVERLGGEIAAKSEEIRMLEEKLNNGTDGHEETRAALDDAKKRVAQMAALEAQLDEEKLARVEACATVDELREKLSAVEELEGKLEEEVRSHAEAKSALEQAKSKLSDMQDIADELKEAVKAHDDSRAALEKTEAELIAAQDVGRQFEEEAKVHEESRKRIEALRMELEAENAAHLDTRSQLEHLQATLATMEDTVRQESQQSDEANLALNAKVEQLGQALQEEVAAHEETKTALDSATVKLSDLQTERTEAIEAEAASADQVKALRAKIETLEAKLKDTSEVCARLETKASAHGEAMNELEQLRERVTLLSDAEQKAAELRQELEGIQEEKGTVESKIAGLEQARGAETERAERAEEQSRLLENQIKQEREEKEREWRKAEAKFKRMKARIVSLKEASTATEDTGTHDNSVQVQSLYEQLKTAENARAESEVASLLSGLIVDVIDDVEHRTMQKAMEDLANENNSMKTELSQLVTEKSDMDVRLQESLSTISQLECEAKEEVSRMEETLMKVESRILDGNKEVSRLKEENQTLTQRLADVDQVSADAASNLEERDNRIATLENDLNEKTQALHQAKDDLVNASKSLEGVEGERNNLRAELEALSSERVSHEKKVEELEETVKSLTAQLSQTLDASAVDELSLELAQVQNDLVERQRVLSAREEELIKLREQYEEGERAIEARESELSAVKNELEEKEDALELAKSDLLNASKTIGDVEEERHQLKAQLESLYSAREIQDKKVAELEAAVQDLTAELSHVSDTSATDTLKAELTQLQGDILTGQRIIDEQGEELASLRGRYEEQGRELLAKEDALTTLQTHMGESSEELTGLRDEVEELRSDVEAKDQSVSALRSKLSDVKGELVQVKMKRDESEHALEQQWKAKAKALHEQHKVDLDLALDQLKGKLKVAEQQAQHRETQISGLMLKLTQAGSGLAQQRSEATKEIASKEEYWKGQMARLEASLKQAHQQEMEQARAAEAASNSEAGELALYKKKNRLVLKRKDERIGELLGEVEALKQDLQTKQKGKQENDDAQESMAAIQERVKSEYASEIASLKKRNELLGKETMRLKQAVVKAQNEAKTKTVQQPISSPQPTLSQRRRSFDGIQDLESGAIDSTHASGSNSSPNVRTPLKQAAGFLRGKSGSQWSFRRRTQLLLILYVAVLHMVILYLGFGSTEP